MISLLRCFEAIKLLLVINDPVQHGVIYCSFVASHSTVRFRFTYPKDQDRKSDKHVEMLHTSQVNTKASIHRNLSPSDDN